MDAAQLQTVLESFGQWSITQNAAQVQGLRDLFTQQAQLLQLQAGDRGRHQQPKLIAKYVNTPVFKGVPAEWEDWSFGFKRTVRSMNKDAYDFMLKCENRIEDVTDDNVNFGMIPAEDGQVLLPDPERVLRSGELYDILCQVCGGEALSLIKSVLDLNGFAAWQVLYKKYNPKTMARGVRLLCEVTNPAKIKDMSGIEAAITKWEDRLATLKTQFGEGFSEWTQIAIFTNMMPTNIQDYIYSIMDDTMKYVVIKEKVRGMVSNKLAIGMGPAPMDIGGLHGHGGEEEWHDEGEYDVGAVTADTKCYRCQGYGHFSRDCATKLPDKGKGKGKGQGYEKGKGKGKPDKGKGKGKTITCWTCGKDGHRSNECPTKVQSVDDEPEEEVPIGGVWMIGAVEAAWEGAGVDDDWKVVGRKGSLKKTRANPTEQVMIAEVEANEKEWTRASGMMFHVANVAKPLASAAKVCEAGNRIVMDPEPGKSYVENVLTGERMLLKKERGTFVFEVEYLDDGETGHITLDSGAGVSVWPKKLKTELKTLPKKDGLNMVAANGTKIENFGQKLISFKGLKSPFSGRA
jgi:hypothetical protein